MKPVRRFIALLVLVGAATTALIAQAPATPAFEVASIKPSDDANSSPIGPIPQMAPSGVGRIALKNMPLRLLVRLSYDLQDFQITGGPSWQMSKRFDITAKAPDGFSGDTKQLLAMVKPLLADRFGLKAHIEQREMPTYSLLVARSDGKLGPDMSPSKDDCSDPAAQQKRTEELTRGGAAATLAALSSPDGLPCMVLPMADPQGGIGMHGRGQPIAIMTTLLTQVTGRMVHDKTGLTGLYDWKIKFDPEVMMRAASQLGLNLPTAAFPPSDNPSILTALREQLGLKLDSDKGPVDVLVIDEAKEPTAD
jgi:uncharacterized protein (TIGR03435 family)